MFQEGFHLPAGSDKLDVPSAQTLMQALILNLFMCKYVYNSINKCMYFVFFFIFNTSTIVFSWPHIGHGVSYTNFPLHLVFFGFEMCILPFKELKENVSKGNCATIFFN